MNFSKNNATKQISANKTRKQYSNVVTLEEVKKYQNPDIIGDIQTMRQKEKDGRWIINSDDEYC